VGVVNKLYSIQAAEGELVPTWTEDIVKILEKLRNGKLKPEELNQQMIKQSAKELLKAVQTGFNRNLQGIDFDTPDYNYLAQLRTNIFNFAGAKSYQHLKDLNELLFENGEVVPFYKFRDKMEEYRSAAMKVEKRYNENWLKSEYNNAMAQAQAARRWKDFEEDADIFPNLEYRTAGDAQVRYSHQKLNKIILPINHSFWDKYYPPNDWGCRCRARPTDAKPTPEDEIKDIILEPTFKNNVGKTAYIFPEKHPYYKENEANKKAIIERVSEFGRMENATGNRKLYDAFDLEKYQQVDFNQESGGFIVAEKGWEDTNEMSIAKLLMNLGERVVLLKVRNRTALKTPDATINETKFDFKALAKCTQNAVYQNIRRGKTQARHVVLHLSDVNQKALINGILQAVRMDKHGEIQGVMMLHKKQKVFVHRSEVKEEILTDIIKKAFR
jgi:SPP1 gp7 family putative phage head morphogenesis protein